MGSVIHCIELKIERSSDSKKCWHLGATPGKEGRHVTIRLRSGEMRKVLSECRAIGGF